MPTPIAIRWRYGVRKREALRGRHVVKTAAAKRLASGSVP